MQAALTQGGPIFCVSPDILASAARQASERRRGQSRMSDSEEQQYTGLGWTPPNNKRPKPAKYDADFSADFSADTSADFSADFSTDFDADYSGDYGMGIETGTGKGTAVVNPGKGPS